MPFRPLREEEKQHYESEIKRLQDEINLREQTIVYFQELIKQGTWTSDEKWGEKK